MTIDSSAAMHVIIVVLFTAVCANAGRKQQCNQCHKSSCTTSQRNTLLYSKHGDTNIATRVLLHVLLVEAKPSASNLDCCRVSLTAGDVIEWIYGLWNLILQQICMAPFERPIQYLDSHSCQARSHQQLFAKATSHLSGL